MLKTDPGLTTELPVWLVICTAAILVGRIALFLYEHEHPPVPSDEIHWQDVKADDPASKITDKMILYYFTTKWSGSVRKLESNAFSNKKTVKLINDNFAPKRVVDMSVEEQANSPFIQKLEDKYGLTTVKVFPKLIVTLADGTEVNRSIGARNADLIDKFLDDSMNSACYVRARQDLKEKKWADAAKRFNEYIEKNGLKADRSIYSLIREFICLKLIDKSDEADEVIKANFAGVDPLRWPYPVLAYMNHEIDEKQLLQRTGDSPDRRLEMHSYVGASLFFAGEINEARERLKQCTADSHYKDWPEYQLAEAVLKRMPELRKPAREQGQPAKID